MSKCKIHIPNNGKLCEYTCDEVRLLADHWKKEFRVKNCTDKITSQGMIDRQYNNYCKAIDNFINDCECEK